MEQEPNNMEEILTAVRQALSNLKFGSVEITVHDAKVVQIERKEKVRLNQGQKEARKA